MGVVPGWATEPTNVNGSSTSNRSTKFPIVAFCALVVLNSPLLSISLSSFLTELIAILPAMLSGFLKAFCITFDISLNRAISALFLLTFSYNIVIAL